MNVTNCKRNDGFGGQYQNIIWAIQYAEMNDLKFYYTPFENMEHNYDNDPEFILKKEKFINIINNFPNISELPENESVLQLCGGVDISFDSIENNLSESFKLESFKKIKHLLHQNKPPVFDSSIINIAVHIRKENNHDNHTAGVYSDKYFLDIIDYIRNTYPSTKLFHVYSQGNKNDFLAFENDDVVFHLNESIESTFYSMVAAQILVMSKSSLSYTAAMLNDNIVYYLPFWHKPASTWLIKQ
jgi:hypothetical protein